MYDDVNEHKINKEVSLKRRLTEMYSYACEAWWPYGERA